MTINEKLTQVVLDHLALGYQINASTMRGTQGECGRIDFFKGTELRRVWVTTRSDTTKLTLGIHKQPVPPHIDITSFTNTLWNHDFIPCLEIEWED